MLKAFKYIKNISLVFLLQIKIIYFDIKEKKIFIECIMGHLHITFHNSDIFPLIKI